MEVKQIAVIGAGIMGSGIAHVAALAGYTTQLMDSDNKALEKGRAAIEQNLRRGSNAERLPTRR